MPLIRKRRAQDLDDQPASSSPAQPSSARRRRQQQPDPEPTQASASDGSSAVSGEDDNDDETHAPSNTDIMVKKLVRLALSSEYARQPIRRSDISTKVLGETGTRQFKAVFEGAQGVLKERFGMGLVELPGREKVTVSQRRAAQKTDKPSSSNKSWILTSTLPAPYRTPKVLSPAQAPQESTYTALYTFIIAVITLNGGSLQESKLDRYLKRTNADSWTPMDSTEKVLQRMCKEGYLVRNREMDGGEETVEYIVGPRGKVEVGAMGVAGLVREVYGHAGAGAGAGESEEMTIREREVMEDFEQRLARSLGLRREVQLDEDEDEGGDVEKGHGRRTGQDDDEGE